MNTRRGIVLLDRDGVLNRVVVDPEHGTIDSPLHPSQVELIGGVPEALQLLQSGGFALAVCTNQPAAAKGKTTLANLEATHSEVLRQAGIAKVASQMCRHRSEDGCACRKPQPGMLLAALGELGRRPSDEVWMVGDGVTDMDAARAAGVKAAFVGPRKTDAFKIFEDRDLEVDFWGKNLLDFAQFVTRRGE